MFAKLASGLLLFAVLAGAAATADAADQVNGIAPSPGFKANVTRPASVRHVNLAISKSTIIDFDDEIRDILVSNPQVADAVVRTNRRLYIIGNKYGMTNVYVYGADNRQIADIELQIQPDVSTLEALLNRVQPHSQIHVEAVTGAVLLTGTVNSALDASEAFDVASKFLGGSGTATQTTGTATAITTSGTVQVLNGLKIRGKDQIMLRVTVAEVQRTAIKSLGIDLSETTSGNFATSIASTNPFAVNGSTTSGTVAKLGYTNGANSINATVRAYEQNGLLRVLSEPNLTAISGEEATFLVGGEYPIPVSQVNGVISVEFKKYGIGLSFIPVVLSEGRISLKVSTEVSEPTSQGSFSVSSSSTSTSLSISALRVRRASSTVEMSSGATMVMAGLMNDSTSQALAGTPGLMNLPILGTLFRSRDFQREQTELAIFVQPIVVEPVAAGRLVRPDQNFAVSSDAAANFMGRLNKIYRASNQGPAGPYHGQYGFIYE